MKAAPGIQAPRGLAARRILAPLTLFAALLASNPAAAQSPLGPFAIGDSYWIGPIGGAGVQIQGGQIWVDVNGNDLTDVGIDTFHPIPSGLATGWAFQLTPSRRIMVARTSTGAPCPATPASIRLYTIPAQNGANLVQLGSQQNLARCIDAVGFFDHPNLGTRTAFFREAPHPTTGAANILWWDLVTGVAAPSPFPYDASFGFVHFAPIGEMAWVQHGIGAAGGTKYSLVSLCPTTLGQASQPGLGNQTGVISATVENGTSGFVVVARNPLNQVVQSYDYVPCSPPTPTTGACCIDGGGCIDGTTQSECEVDYGGTWNGALSLCATASCPAPPTVILGLTKTGPASAVNGGNVVYTLTARNDGTLAAGSVSVADSIPLDTSFLSASDGGTYDNFSRKVTWSLGTLGPGATQNRTLTVIAPCSGTPAVNQRYFVSGTPGGTIAGAPTVNTPLTAAPTTPLTIALSSVALAPTPLGTGDSTRHTVQLTNTLPVLREGVRFNFQGGAASDIVQITDAAGGTVTSFGGLRQWEGSIGPNATVSIVWKTTIRECRPAVAAVEQLNRGVLINVTTRCSQNLGFAFPTQSIPVAGSPFALRLESTSHGPAQNPGTPNAAHMIVARPAATIDFDLRYLHPSAATAPTCAMSMTFPIGLDPATDPPFIGTPPAGTTWDAPSRTISWTGTPAANDSVRVRFRGLLGVNGCLATLSALGSHGPCLNDLNAALGVIGVPVPPAGEHVIGLASQSGLWTYQPGAAQWNPLMCGVFQQLNGVGRTEDGTLWVAGMPTLRLNPTTLQFGFLPASVMTAMDMDFPFDAAGDPRDTTVVFTGYKSGFGLRVRRYNPRTGQVTSILNDTSPLTFGPGNSVAVSPNGTIGVQTQGAILVIDPANPGAYQVMDDPSLNGYGSLCLDTDLNYLVVESGTPRHLLKLDRTSGVFTPIVDLTPSFPNPGDAMSGVAAAPNQNVYVCDFGSLFGVVRRAQGNAIDMLPSQPVLTDLLHRAGAGGVDVPPEEGVVPARLELTGATPNPFVGSTLIRFGLPRAGDVTLEVFDLLGRRVRRLAAGELEAGPHALAWDGRDDAGGHLGAGLYFTRLIWQGEVRRMKVVLGR